MVIKQNNQYSDRNQQYDEIEYALYCDSLEKQYKQAKEDGLFEILKVLELDKEHSDSKLVQAINYFNAKNGIIEKDAPIDFLTERENRIVNRIKKELLIFGGTQLNGAQFKAPNQRNYCQLSGY